MACRASRNLHAADTGGQHAPVTVTPVMTTPVSPVTATIHPGQFVAIIGRSGAGKTTHHVDYARAYTDRLLETSWLCSTSERAAPGPNFTISSSNGNGRGAIIRARGAE